MVVMKLLFAVGTDCMQKFSTSREIKDHKEAFPDQCTCPFSCPVCFKGCLSFKTFKQQAHRDTHIRSHTGNCPYERGECWMSASFTCASLNNFLPTSSVAGSCRLDSDFMTESSNHLANSNALRPSLITDCSIRRGFCTIVLHYTVTLAIWGGGGYNPLNLPKSAHVWDNTH